MNTFPTPIDKWAIAEVKLSLGKGRKKSDLIMPDYKIHTALSKEILQNKLDVSKFFELIPIIKNLCLSNRYVNNFDSFRYFLGPYLFISTV